MPLTSYLFRCFQVRPGSTSKSYRLDFAEIPKDPLQLLFLAGGGEIANKHCP